jgi:hypothetical protein
MISEVIFKIYESPPCILSIYERLIYNISGWCSEATLLFSESRLDEVSLILKQYTQERILVLGKRNTRFI